MNIIKYLIHKAVLWPYSTKNGYGELVFGTAVGIAVRWEERSELFISKNGKELVSRAICHINQDIVPDSFMYLGELSDLSTAQKADPKLVTDAFSVKAFRSIDSVTGKDTLRKVYLFGGSVGD